MNLYIELQWRVLIHEHHLDFSWRYICTVTRDIAHLRIHVERQKGVVHLSMVYLCMASVVQES